MQARTVECKRSSASHALLLSYSCSAPVVAVTSKTACEALNAKLQASCTSCVPFQHMALTLEVPFLPSATASSKHSISAQHSVATQSRASQAAQVQRHREQDCQAV